MTRAARRMPGGFGPRWLATRLTALLPHLPQLRLCVAFSGGADSTALLAALAAMRPRPQQLRAVHIDHGLQPNSRGWAAHCRRVARALGVACAVRRAALTRSKGASLEALAREARYRLLGAALQPGEVLLTAHHQDDQLETVLLQLLRGAGVAGIAAMPESTPFAGGLLLRPLLHVPRRALHAWASAQQLRWVEDDSNRHLHLDRNYLRARVLPALTARWPAAAATVARSAAHAATAQRLLDALAAADVARAQVGAALAAPALRALSPERRRNALRYWITAAKLLPPPTARLDEIAGPLLAARADAQPLVAWPGARVQRQAQLLLLSRTTAAQPAPPAPPRPATAWHWRDSRSCVLPAPLGRLTLRGDARGPLDLDALGAVLTVRARRGGERLRVRRGGPRRALKSLLQEARVAPQLRAHLPLVFDGARLIAVADLWLDAAVQAHAGSARRGRLLWRGAG